MENKTIITVKTTVNLPVKKVWEYFTEPKHITNWNFASDDWFCPDSSNDLRVGGKFTSRMEAKDGSFGFDFEGVYTEVNLYEKLAYKIADGRRVEVFFDSKFEDTEIIESFEAENENSAELQQQGWQAILDNFKKYAENYEI